MTAGRRVVFLDRDGVLVVPEERDGKGYAVRRAADLRLYPDVVEALARLAAGGYALVVVTNQPDVATGLLPAEELAAMHERLLAELPLAGIRVCPHGQAEGCACRKPRPGLLLAEGEGEPVDYAASWMVGDRDGDVAAGLAAGCRTVFVDRGWRDESGRGADVVAPSVAEAADAILTS